MTIKTELEQQLYAALKRITQYDSTERIRRESERSYGLTYGEALEYAYENVKAEAKAAIYGVRVPKVRPVATAAGTLKGAE